MHSHEQTKVWASTENLFANVLLHYPDNHIAQEHIAKIALAKGDLDLALTAYKATLERRKDPAAAYINMGAVYAQLKDEKNEMEMYKKALAINGDLAPARYNLARLYEDLEEFDNATEQYQRILEIDTGFMDASKRLEMLIQQQLAE